MPVHVNKNVKDWWLQYHTPEEDFDHEYHQHPQTSVEVGSN